MLREWAIAGVLSATPDLLAELPLASMGSPAQLRGVELAARMPIETDRDPVAWRKMLDFVSSSGAHPIWRRAVLLAIVHSEVTKRSIMTMGDALLADDAALLRELIPIMLAVDVRPVRDLLLPGADPSSLPAGLNVPSGPAWWPLVAWLLTRGPALPPKAVPEVAELYVGWCAFGMFYPSDPLTPLIVAEFKLWLTSIELASDWKDWRERNERAQPFGGALTSDQLERVEEYTRSYLATFAIRAPDTAKAYLEHVRTLNRKDRICAALMKSRGSLAQAAPEELAAITLDYLRKPEDDKDDLPGQRRSRLDDDALAHADKSFLPAAPSQGPFYDLLTHAPKVGLLLIHNLIDEVVAFYAEGKDAGDDALVIQMPNGSRRFPWVRTYAWSDHSRCYSVTSALMALEFWAHERIERGDEVVDVIIDVIGEGEPPAAYALVAVHVILSHWPKSAAAGVPFVGCPELLSLDLSRPVQMALSGIDLFGFGQLTKQPANGPRVESLTQRVSRRISLDQLLSRYALHERARTERDRLVSLLSDATIRLGRHEAGDDRSDPRLMAFLALNMLDSDNWVEEEAHDENGNPVTGFRYNPPPNEVAHFQPLQARLAENNKDVVYTNKINSVVDNVDKSSSQLAATLQTWAEEKSPEGAIPEGLEQAVIGAAMIAMRDGTAELRKEKRDWAEKQFVRALDGKPDAARQMRTGMLYNPVAMAFAGRVFALRGTKPLRNDYKRLFEMVVADPAAARGAGPTSIVLDEIDSRLRRSILRVAFSSAVYFWHSYEVPAEVKQQIDDDLELTVSQAIKAELQWIVDSGIEPAWPHFAEDEIRPRSRRHRLRIAQPQEDESTRPQPDASQRFVNHQTAALWLSGMCSKAEADITWMHAIETAYAPWTFVANGAGMTEDEEVGRIPTDWNAAFFSVMTWNLRSRTLQEISASLEPLFALPDKSFFDLMEDVLFKIDVLYFNEKAITSEVAIAIRSAFADRLSKSDGWRRLRLSTTSGIEMHLGPAVATVFFSKHEFGQAPRCCLPRNFAPRSIPYTPLLQRHAAAAPCLFVALCVMSWVEVAPTSEHLPLVAEFASAAMAARPDDKKFWADYGIGGRICNWLADRFDADPEAFAPHREVIVRTIAYLVAAGIVEARRLELKLQSGN